MKGNQALNGKKDKPTNDKKGELRFWQRNTYKVKVACVNCDKRFKFNTPIGIDVCEGNLPYGLYLHNNEGYYTIEGSEANHAHYIKCVKCGSEKLRKVKVV